MRFFQSYLHINKYNFFSIDNKNIQLKGNLMLVYIQWPILYIIGISKYHLIIPYQKTLK